MNVEVLLLSMSLYYKSKRFHRLSKIVKMKKKLIVVFAFTCMSFVNWQTNFDAAKLQAKEKHEYILLNFSGSDWCGPCMRMRKEIFDSEVFSGLASSSLVMVNADFPRNKKNQLESSVKKQNEALADKYNPNGHFPFTLLLDADGKIIKLWDGLPKEDARQFTQVVKSIIDGRK